MPYNKNEIISLKEAQIIYNNITNLNETKEFIINLISRYKHLIAKTNVSKSETGSTKMKYSGIYKHRFIYFLQSRISLNGIEGIEERCYYDPNSYRILI